LSSEQQVYALGQRRRPSDEDLEPGAVKLTDLYDMDGFQHDVNARAPVFVRDHLVSIGLEELASIDFWDEDVRRFFVATDAGLYVAVFTPRRDIRFEPKLEATVTPWQAVHGVHVTIVSEIGDQTVVSLKIDEPEFERSSNRDRELKPLAEFGKVCLLRHGRH